MQSRFPLFHPISFRLQDLVDSQKFLKAQPPWNTLSEDGIMIKSEKDKWVSTQPLSPLSLSLSPFTFLSSFQYWSYHNFLLSSPLSSKTEMGEGVLRRLLSRSHRSRRWVATNSSSLPLSILQAPRKALYPSKERDIWEREHVRSSILSIEHTFIGSVNTFILLHSIP